ncbi:BTAD domain-containing putative transcriptional regulator [Mycobacterium shimoidei]|uniref:BTAD domain-containing putative transcriptional regulator n=1 Tax=Mycobacterium shimoidei TaxID=29313 RepID=UPI000A028CD5|nr:BTAD domain-containing putative transcriptional regulator [Mycobacterium shimoidei]MCV7261286.1 AAA family ATPase [Mycobacterium shimoidei]
MELGVLGPLQVQRNGVPVIIPGAKPRAILTMLGLRDGSVVPAETLIELLWGDDPPRTAAKALQTHISALRRTLGDGFVLTEGTGWILSISQTDASRYKLATKMARDAAAAGDTSQAVTRFEEALTLWRGVPELPDSRRGMSEKTRWTESHASLVEDRADALLATGRAAEIIGELEAAVADAPLRERRWGQLMLALYRAGRQGEALGAYKRARSLLADELGVDPGPELRRLEAAIVAQDTALETPVAQQSPTVMRAVTFLLTDIEGSTAAWEADADAMAVALARHDELVEQIVTSRGGRVIKTRGEGDATFSVFERPSAAAAAAIELQDAISHEPWALHEPMRIRISLHTGEAELRDGDYFGRAVNRAARLRSLAVGGQILCSGATAELVIDSLPDDVLLADLGMRQLRNLARPEHVFELRLQTADDAPAEQTTDAPMQRPDLPAVLGGPGPFIGRHRELEKLLAAWQTALSDGMHAVLIAGEPGVGKTRLAGEWSGQAYQLGAVVLYGRCDEDLGAPYQPFAEAFRSLVPCIGAKRLRGLRGVEALLALVPGLVDVLPDVAAPTRADPDTERYALFDAVVAVLELASASAPIVLVLDDLHWAAKPTLLLLRHLLRFGDHARVQVVGTYRSTDLDRSHPLAAMLADLHRDGTANRLTLGGLDEQDVTAYVAEAGYDDEELARALAAVTGGNPFFLIEALRHVDESGGVWDPSTLPQGVREAVSRRLSRLPSETNKALAAAAVVGSRFALDLVEQVTEQDLVDAFDEACKAGIVIEEPGGRYRFNHAIVRQSLLAELPSVRRMRLHQRIATTLEAQPGADDELLAELAYHYFECAWAGNAAKAVEYCRRAADQAMARLAYEGAADLYDRAVHALEEIDDELPDRDEHAADLLVARCEALLAAGDVVSAAGAVSQLQESTAVSTRIAAWATCLDGLLSMLIHPERLDEVEAALGAAAEKLARLGDAAGEAKAHTVHAACLARLGRIGDCEVALDNALTAARRARDHRRVNPVLAGAPLAALWGPNPVPRAGGRCLDVVRLLRITTDSPAVEATSTRCQAVLEAFRGRAAAARRMIDSARRTVTELGLRHALLEVEQFAGIVELVVDDPASAEPHLRQAYKGFRRMGLDADTAETAALLGRTCLALGRDAEADELCAESERLAGNALKASIAWRTLRAHLLSCRGEHDEAARVAEAAVDLAERTDLLVDHGEACLALATVLSAAGDHVKARSAAERAADLYERKGAAALVERARRVLGKRVVAAAPAAPEAPSAEPDNACVRAVRRLDAAYDRGGWEEVEQLVAAVVSTESRRRLVGRSLGDLPYREWVREARLFRETVGPVRYRHAIVAVRGERLALTRLEVGPADLSPGAPRDEFLQLYGVDEEGHICLHLRFDVEDLDDAIAELDARYARFEGEIRRVRLENAASRADRRSNELFAERRWDEISALLAEDIRIEDRRRGFRRESNDRATEIANIQAIAAVGGETVTATPLALRGDRLYLSHVRCEGRDARPPSVDADLLMVDALAITEVDANGLIVARTYFDLDDMDAAIAELDARNLAGEAAPFAQAWSLVAEGYAGFNRREFLATTPDAVSIDHRRGPAFAPGDFIDYIQAAWNDSPDTKIYIEAVHRLSSIGAVVTHVARGISDEGFDAEWRDVFLLIGEGNLVSRCELFNEADLDAVIARFEELNRPTPQLENAASRLYERLKVCYAARDFEAITEMLADNVWSEDRRRVVNSGFRQGPDAMIAELAGLAEAEIDLASEVVATRGASLVLNRLRAGSHPLSSDGFYSLVFDVIEIDVNGRFVARIVFDANDIEGAIAELDARYLAGEAAPYARVWQSAMDTLGELNRHAPGPMIRGLSYTDRRRVPFGPRDFGRAVEELWALASDTRYRFTAVHALDAHGVVASLIIEGSAEYGNELQWARAFLLVPEEPRLEIYQESDVDVAIARFEELKRPAPRLENAASRLNERLLSHFAACQFDAIAEMLADRSFVDDRRRVVNAGLWQGRDAVTSNLRVLAGDANTTSSVIALRGERLVLSRNWFANNDLQHGNFGFELLGVIEVDADNRIAAIVVFDPDDLNTAFEELERRYVAGEAGAHSRTWSVMTRAYEILNARGLPPTTPDWVNVDHRHGATFAPGDLTAYISAAWKDLEQYLHIHIEAVHRLSDSAAVVTQVLQGTTRDGFDAEWRTINLYTVDGDLISRCELFDEADLDAAFARFDELTRPVRQLENATSHAFERLLAYISAGKWDTVAEITAEDFSIDDRRRVVNAGIRHGRDDAIKDSRAAAAVGFTVTMLGVTAIRGERLALIRVRASGPDPEAVQNDALNLVEVNPDGRYTAIVVFDLEDIDAAFEELDSRYLAGEAAAYARTWSAMTRIQAAYNRHQITSTTMEDCVSIDHRQGRGFESGDLIPFLRATWNVAPDVKGHIETVHRLSSLGVVVTEVMTGTSLEGFDAEWREIGLFAFEGDLVCRFELFDETDLDAALARFDELDHRQPADDSSG